MEERAVAAQELLVRDDLAGAARAAAEIALSTIAEAVRRRGRCAVALSGGSTPRALYSRLSDRRFAASFGPLDWNLVHFFWGDERLVPPDSPESNVRMARESFLGPLAIPESNIHPPRTESGDEQIAARGYEATIDAWFGVTEGSFPQFDLVLLGMGEDGHTASLFPGDPSLEETRRRVLGIRSPSRAPARITLTLPVLNAASQVIFLVAGRGKAATLRSVLEGSPGSGRLPARRVRPRAGRVTWVVDREAAAMLSRRE